jgi:hypothetical protein
LSADVPGWRQIDIRKSRIGDEFRMDEEGELFDAVGDPGRRARVVGVRVDGHGATTELRKHGLTGGSCVVEAAGCDDDEFGPLFEHGLP